MVHNYCRKGISFSPASQLMRKKAACHCYVCLAYHFFQPLSRLSMDDCTFLNTNEQTNIDANHAALSLRAVRTGPACPRRGKISATTRDDGSRCGRGPAVSQSQQGERFWLERCSWNVFLNKSFFSNFLSHILAYVCSILFKPKRSRSCGTSSKRLAIPSRS